MFGLPCYEFNEALGRSLDDSGCLHCRKFLTLECPHIAEFMDEDEEEDEA